MVAYHRPSARFDRPHVGGDAVFSLRFLRHLRQHPAFLLLPLRHPTANTLPLPSKHSRNAPKQAS